MYQHIYLKLFCVSMLICTSCICQKGFYLHEDKLACMWNKHKQLISQVSQSYYQIHGVIFYTINHHNKILVRFVWAQDNSSNYNIKFFDVFGLMLISIVVENGLAHISNSIIYQDNNLNNEIQKWFVDINYFLVQLQQWIVGLPGNNTEYNLNYMGYLSHINCLYNYKNISIYYRCYYINSMPTLPKILDIYYGKHYVKLKINNWSLQ